MKRTILFYTIFFVLLGPMVCYADGKKYDGNELLSNCKRALATRSKDVSWEELCTSEYSSGYCYAFIIGVASTLLLNSNESKNSPVLCMSPQVTVGQFVRVVVKHLENHPEELHQHGAMLVSQALKEAFPCKAIP